VLECEGLLASSLASDTVPADPEEEESEVSGACFSFPRFKRGLWSVSEEEDGSALEEGWGRLVFSLRFSLSFSRADFGIESALLLPCSKERDLEWLLAWAAFEDLEWLAWAVCEFLE